MIHADWVIIIPAIFLDVISWLSAGLPAVVGEANSW